MREIQGFAEKQKGDLKQLAVQQSPFSNFLLQSGATDVSFAACKEACGPTNNISTMQENTFICFSGIRVAAILCNIPAEQCGIKEPKTQLRDVVEKQSLSKNP